jgi:Nucleotide modification associated domain 3
MQVVLLRVGIDTGSGGIHGPLFKNGSFEFIPIPDGWGADSRTYGNTKGRRGRALVDYFPVARRARAFKQAIHFDPEFATYTYGDPTVPKSSLRKLVAGDLLVFYGGLKGWDFDCEPALYIIGHFEVSRAGFAPCFTGQELRRLFGGNFHVKHRKILADQRERLVLVKGGAGSRLLQKAVRISSHGKNRDGRPLHRLSGEMQEIFGDFDGHTSIERSPSRWVAPEFTERGARFVRGLT